MATVQLRDDLHRWVKIKAAETGRTVQDIVDAAVALYAGQPPTPRVEPQKQEPTRLAALPGAESVALPTLNDLVRSGAVRTLQGEGKAVQADGKWMLEGQYSDASGQHTTPFFKIVEDGVARWEDYDKEDLPAEIVTMLEIELSSAKPKIRLKEVQE